MAAYGGEDVEDDYEDDSEDDGLDDLADPRIMEVDSEAEEAPQLVKAETGKKNKKRAAEEETDDHATKLVTKLTKNEEEKPKSKKLKNNEGKAVAGAEVKPETKKETKKEKKDAKKTEAKKIEASPVNGKKVQFAEKLEQGPTPSKAAQPTKRTVQGVQIEDRKNGTGPSAKKGDRVGMRYIGKLKNGKMFDCTYSSFPWFELPTNYIHSQQEGQAIQLQDGNWRSHQGLGYWCRRHGSWW
jgi:FK506-binding nuclear protein